jgi:hypothetical protein
VGDIAFDLLTLVLQFLVPVRSSNLKSVFYREGTLFISVPWWGNLRLRRGLRYNLCGANDRAIEGRILRPQHRNRVPIREDLLGNAAIRRRENEIRSSMTNFRLLDYLDESDFLNTSRSLSTRRTIRPVLN